MADGLTDLSYVQRTKAVSKVPLEELRLSMFPYARQLVNADNLCFGIDLTLTMG